MEAMAAGLPVVPTYPSGIPEPVTDDATGPLGPERGLPHLLPSPLGAGAAKRLNLFLRWMVRGPDAVDFGIWKRVPPAALLIPLDTHIGRISQHLGLTRRNTTDALLDLDYVEIVG